jgi:hypothetical protein
MAKEEDDQDILDRRLAEMLGETRVILPSVTVLFAFLLTIPFSAGFAALNALDRGAYFIAFLSAALAMIFLIGQSAYHRLCGKPYDKALMLVTANRQAIAAIVLLAISMTAVVFLVADVMYPGYVPGPLASAVLVFASATWFVLPLARRFRQDRRDASRSELRRPSS